MTIAIARRFTLSVLLGGLLLGVSPAQAETAPATAPAAVAPVTGEGAADALAGTPEALAAGGEEGVSEGEVLAHDLSPWGMYQNADVVVKGVMIGLALASVITWTIWLAKGLEILLARRRLRGELAALKGLRSLTQAAALGLGERSLSQTLIADAQEELRLSAGTQSKDGIKERVAFRLERLVAASGRQMNQGTGVLATIPRRPSSAWRCGAWASPLSSASTPRAASRTRRPCSRACAPASPS